MSKWYLYLCNRKGVLYTGITTNLNHRINQHKAELLYSEEYNYKEEAAKREKQIKGWNRQKKMQLLKGKSQVGEFTLNEMK